VKDLSELQHEHLNSHAVRTLPKKVFWRMKRVDFSREKLTLIETQKNHIS